MNKEIKFLKDYDPYVKLDPDDTGLGYIVRVEDDGSVILALRSSSEGGYEKVQENAQKLVDKGYCEWVS